MREQTLALNEGPPQTHPVSAIIRDCVEAKFPEPDHDRPRFPGLIGIITGTSASPRRTWTTASRNAGLTHSGEANVNG